MTHTTIGMNLEDTTLREKSQSQAGKVLRFHLQHAWRGVKLTRDKDGKGW